MKPLLAVLLFSVFFFSTACSQTPHLKKLDSLFDLLQNRGLANGSLAVSVNGKIAYQRAIGFAMIDSNKKIAANTDTKYRIGSVTKVFTAVLVFQLVDEGKLRLDEKLAEFFPLLPGADKITIREMLYHRSGLHDYTKDTGFPEWMDKPKAHEELLKIIADKGLDFKPGTRSDYSNSNYLLLSYVVEKICRMTYAQAVEKRITTKIGLQNTYYGQPVDVYRNEAASFKYSDGKWEMEKATDMSIHNGAGSIVSTPTDLAVFIQKLFNGGLVSNKSLANMKTMIDGYGMGIFSYDFDTAKGYGHNGRLEEFYSAVRYFPGKKIAVSYVTNGILFPRVDILDAILKICFNKDYTIPFSKPAAFQSVDLDKYLGTYSSANLPFKVSCRKKDEKLVLEAAGKSMDAEPVTPGYFMNLETGYFFQFNPQKGELQIKETDNIYYLDKEK
jgi:CubicO group peptidase (beta-lactamase class C family)